MELKTIKLETTLKQLNGLFDKLGTWKNVSYVIQYNRATVNRWFSGDRTPTASTRRQIYLWHKAFCVAVK